MTEVGHTKQCLYPPFSLQTPSSLLTMHSTCSLLPALLACLVTALATNIMGGEGIGGVMWFVRDMLLVKLSNTQNITMFEANTSCFPYLILS